MKNLTLILVLLSSAANANVVCMNYGEGMVSCSNGAMAWDMGGMTVIRPPRQEYDYGPFGTSMRPIQTPDMQVMPVIPVPTPSQIGPRPTDMFWPQ